MRAPWWPVTAVLLAGVVLGLVLSIGVTGFVLRGGIDEPCNRDGTCNPSLVCREVQRGAFSETKVLYRCILMPASDTSRYYRNYP